MLGLFLSTTPVLGFVSLSRATSLLAALVLFIIISLFIEKFGMVLVQFYALANTRESQHGIKARENLVDSIQLLF